MVVDMNRNMQASQRLQQVHHIVVYSCSL